jgi:hypothetical protein
MIFWAGRGKDRQRYQHQGDYWVKAEGLIGFMR